MGQSKPASDTGRSVPEPRTIAQSPDPGPADQARETVQALKNFVAKDGLDPEHISRVYFLSKNPADLPSPIFNLISEDELMVLYKNLLDDDTSFVILQTYSEDPQTRLEEQGRSFQTVKIGEEDFHIPSVSASPEIREAYAIREDWLIHLASTGFDEAEFRNALTDLTVEFLE